MSSLVSTSSESASPRMIAVSACLHGLFVLAIILVSWYVAKPPKPPEEPILRAKLVQASPEPSAPDKLPENLAGPSNSEPVEPVAQVERSGETPQEVRAVLEERTLSAPAESIHVAKRKKQMRRVEKPKPPAKKPETPVAKKEDPSAFLEKRLADLRKQVEAKSGDPAVPEARRNGGEATPGTAKPGVPDGSESLNRELFLWFAQVRSRVNARWSVFDGNRHSQRVTVVGVRIADDGGLLEASIDEASGDEAFDRSAMRAVYQAAPFPQVPPEVGGKIRKEGGLAFRFTAKGMQ
jgi:colicin import membrane protein